jgi:methylenetetrahydrofolate reductase (NADPH)
MFIRDILAQRRPVFSFEFFPPKTDEAAKLLEKTIAELGPLEPDFVSVTYGAGGTTREKTIDIVSRIKKETGIEAMAHLTCVGATRDDLKNVLDRLVDAGVENVLALRGDPPKGETTFRYTEGGFRYANELAAFVREQYDGKLCIGGACYPEKHTESVNPAVDLANLKRKVQDGAEFVITQLFFDNRRYFEFVDYARDSGVTVPIIPGIMPITNANQAEKMTSMCGVSLPYKLAAALDGNRADPEAILEIGIAHATVQCIELLNAGVPGIHFYTLNRSKATQKVLVAIREAGLSVAYRGVINPPSLSASPPASRG